ncbi:tail hyaluronidase/tail fiber [Bacteroides phage PhiCrAssBcn1]|nr:tail hyaluronidase/tail fiber [Bacteroides phage PhiCrAssBcn1]WCF57516.1 tail hyaluronidase/tail fiber [Bacteroides phage PhiCrAssBcn2]
MKDIQQLIKKNSQEGRYEDIFPKTFLDAVIDKESGTTLTDILSSFNMYFLSYTGSRETTRLEVPMSLRKQGLWITYVLYDGNTITEWYGINAVDDASWQDGNNWRLGSNMLVGDISISAGGNWIINGVDTGIPARGEKGDSAMLRVNDSNKLQVSYTNGNVWIDLSDNPVYTQFRVNNNKLEQSIDLGETWSVVSDYIAAWFRFTGTAGSSQADNVGKIQISRDNGAIWSDLSGEFTNSLHIKGYVATVDALPSTAVQGDIYGVGPTYDPSDTEQTNPIYQLYVKDSTGWVDNGRFTSISAGVVQELGNSETAVISQNTATEIAKKSLVLFGGFVEVETSTIINERYEGFDGIVKYNKTSQHFVYQVGGSYYSSWNDCELYGTPYSYGRVPYPNKLYSYLGIIYHVTDVGGAIIENPVVTSVVDKLETSDYLYNIYYNPITGLETFEPSRLTTNFISVDEGLIFDYSLTGYSTSIAIAAFDANKNILIDKSVIVDAPSASAPNVGRYVVDNTVRFIRVTRLNNSNGLVQTFVHNKADYSSLAKESFNGIKILMNADFTVEGVYINPSTGLESSNPSYSATPFIPIVSGETIYYSGLNGTNGAAIIGIYDKNKTPINLIRGESTYEGRVYVAPEGAAYVRFSYLVSDNPVVIKIISETSKANMTTKNKSNLIVNGFDEFVVSGTWSRDGKNLNVTGGGFTAARLFSETFEDEFVISCKLRTTNNGDFECGVGKQSLAGNYVGVWVTICRNASGSFLKLYYNIDGSYVEQTNLRQTISTGLQSMRWYTLQFSKTTDAASTLLAKVYDDVTGELLATLSTSPNATYAWGYPTCININSVNEYSGFTMYYPKNIYPPVAVYGDSFVEGDTVRTTKNVRWSALLQAQLGKKNCLLYGHGGASSKSDTTRILFQINRISSQYAIIALGQNDASFEAWYQYIDYMLNLCKRSDIIPVLVTTCPQVNQSADYITKMQAINSWIKGSGYNYIDANGAVTTDGLTWKEGYVLADGIHPSALGHQAIFDRIKIDCPSLLNQ